MDDSRWVIRDPLCNFLRISEFRCLNSLQKFSLHANFRIVVPNEDSVAQILADSGYSRDLPGERDRPK
jgi:hypothetical protein